MRDQPVHLNSTAGFKLPRDCVATVVPAGHKIMLAAGDRVTLLQAVGGTATVTTGDGEMVRLSADDSVEFGFVRPTEASGEGTDSSFSIERAWEAAATVYDPEIPVNIVELGLIYRLEAEEVSPESWHVRIDMTVTAPFCGMGDILRQDLHDAVAAMPQVDQVSVQLVFDPPWDASRMSDVARLELGMI